MSNIIKNIHSQLKPDKTTKTQLIEQIRNGRVPELKKGSGSAVGAVAAAAVVALMAGVFALNTTGTKLENDTRTQIQESSTVISETSVTASSQDMSVPFAEESLKIVFDDYIWGYSSDNPYLSQPMIEGSSKMKVLLSNKEITFAGATYTAADTSFVEHAHVSDVGEYIAYGQYTLDGEERTAAICRAKGYGTKERVMLGLGDNMYYVYENKNYDYSDISCISFGIGDGSEIYGNTVLQDRIDMIMPRVMKKIGNGIEPVPGNSSEVMIYSLFDSVNNTQYIASAEGDIDIPEEQEPGVCVIYMDMGNSSGCCIGELYRNDKNNMMYGVFKGDETSYFVRFTPYSEKIYSLYDNSPVSLGIHSKGYFAVDISGDKKISEWKKLLDEISDIAEKYRLDNAAAEEKSPNNFTYSIEANEKKYSFYYYDKITGRYSEEIPKGEKEPNLVIDGEAFRIPDEYAEKLSEKAEQALREQRSYKLSSIGIDSITVDVVDKQDCDKLYKWLSMIGINADKHEEGWKRLEDTPDEIDNSRKEKYVVIKGTSDLFGFVYSDTENLPSYYDSKGTEQKYNVFLDDNFYLIPDEAVKEFMTILDSAIQNKG